MKWKNRNRFELGMLNQIWKRFLTEQKTQTEQMENQKLFENMFAQSEKIKRKRNYPISKLPKSKFPPYPKNCQIKSISRFDSRASSETENDHYQADAEMNDKDDSDVDPISERIIGKFSLTFIMPLFEL